MSRRPRHERRAQIAARDEVELPAESDKLPIVTLAVHHGSRHPWIYRRMLKKTSDEIPGGALVEVQSRDGTFVGRGFYNARSEIAVRLLVSDPQVIPGRAWIAERLRAALDLREETLGLGQRTDAYRWVHSEADGLSGLIIDRFADHVALEVFSAGIYRHLPWIRAAIAEILPKAILVERADSKSERLEHVRMRLPSPPPSAERVVIREDGLAFHADLRHGHKTGFFLDQRDNRSRVAMLAAGEDVFDGFSYTGGFALAALVAGARHVTAVDLDEDAVAMARRNAALNDLERDPRLELVHGNVFDVLRAYRQANRTFSRIVLDPPKLASQRSEKDRALAAYADMNRLALHCLRPGGVLVTCSCSGLISEAELIELLGQVSSRSGFEATIFAIHGAAPDHPFLAHAPEGRYLKAIYSRIRPLA